MRAEIQSLVDHMARCFAEGHLAMMVQPFCVPLPIYVLETDSWVVLKHHRDLVQLMEEKRNALGLKGCNGMAAVVDYVEPESDHGIEAHIRWLHLDSDDRPLVETRTKYYIRQSDIGLQIEMAEITLEALAVSQLRAGT